MHRFTIDAVVDPQTLPRLAGFFGQRAIAPAGLTMRVEDDRMKIEILVADMPDHHARIVAAKLGEAHLVVDVSVGRFGADDAADHREEAEAI